MYVAGSRHYLDLPPAAPYQPINHCQSTYQSPPINLSITARVSLPLSEYDGLRRLSYLCSSRAASGCARLEAKVPALASASADRASSRVSLGRG
jgi:hypothetical protein